MKPPSMKNVESIVEAIRPLLAGHDPAVQGAVLADLLAMFLAGHPRDVRAFLLELHLHAVQGLVALYDEVPPPPLADRH